MGKRMVALDRDRLLGGFDAIDDEVAALIESALITARSVVSTHSALLKQIVDELQEDETLLSERLIALRDLHSKPTRIPRLRKQKAE
jgi:ATP-dependent Zn protease